MIFSLTQNIYLCKSETLHIMKRPVVKIVPTFGEKIVEILVLMIVVCMMIFPYIIYDRLPEIIPSHINIRGEFDGYGNKDSFYVLPLSGLLIYIGLSIMQRYPHAFNYPIGVTEDNYHKLYSLGVKCVRFCKTTCVLIFAYYTYKFALAALGLTITSFPVIILFIGLLFGMIYYFVKMSKC